MTGGPGRRAWLLAAMFTVAPTACTGSELDPLPVPETSDTAPTSTTVPVYFSGVVLAPVPGTTTTTEVVVGPGPGVISGRVQGPDGPVPGATVRLERLVGDASASLEVTTGDDGVWRVEDVLGGRYRVRAWLQPDLATVEPPVLFVAATGIADVVVPVERFGQVVVDTALAPSPPTVGERSNLAVRLSSRTVDANGVVRIVPQAGVSVGLGTGAAWALETPALAATDADGNATFTLVCRAQGPQPLVVTLSPSEVFPVAVPECAVPAPPGTTPEPGGANTSTTSE